VHIRIPDTILVAIIFVARVDDLTDDPATIFIAACANDLADNQRVALGESVLASLLVKNEGRLENKNEEISETQFEEGIMDM